MRSEGHYIGIRKLEGREAELRARAADRGEVFEEKSTVDRLIDELAGVKDFAAVAQRRKEIADDRAKNDTEIKAAWAEIASSSAAHEKRVAEHEAKVKSDHAALTARSSDVDRREVECRAKEAQTAEHNRAALEVRSKWEKKWQRLSEAAAL